MLRVVKHTVLSQCRFHVSSPVYFRWRWIDAGADVWAICVEAHDVRIHQRYEIYFRECDVAGQIYEQSLKLMSMSSDSIHYAVLCAERRDRTPARSIDAAILARLYSRNCDYLMINEIFPWH
jgi:hypothetical protein